MNEQILTIDEMKNLVALLLITFRADKEVFEHFYEEPCIKMMSYISVYGNKDDTAVS